MTLVLARPQMEIGGLPCVHCSKKRTCTEHLDRRYPPSSVLEPRCHHLETQITADVEQFFTKNWHFSDEKAVQKFRAAGFSRVTCCYFPKAKDNRIGFACRLLTLLFLIDDLLEDMSFEEGEAYNDRLRPLALGSARPDPSIPVEYITYDLWESMRACDEKLADEILQPVFTFMKAQTDSTRKDISDLGRYLQYREADVGKALLSALMRFVMELELLPKELEDLEAIDRNCAKHISVVNDIYSWEKELEKSKVSKEEGAVLCSSVKVLAQECNVGAEAAKNILWTMCREWESVHVELARSLASGGPDIMQYCEGLGYQMSGNELWSRTTMRYHSHNV